ncbi:lysophospholipid acyltransferase family protein [Shimia marina]|uniref:Lipid A biosynthesis lauroyl acyltransferase n=1 Tax=Shimia marina TaxID=321267 RepID=A0A0P1FFL0_9RHOB|nr:lysophospholipid acyltransferase family protein [Shimia marina]CUH53690.1 lipid A biosynthesis lauroyl acyltransferase [Shimia marina]SFD70895.1 KDO2-lipid IV(A) lauroyltransferase [Shimia marina]
MDAPQGKFSHRVSDVFIRGFLATMRTLPYEQRITLAGKFATKVLAPLSGSRRRIRENLALVMPELSHDAVEAIVRETPETMGRMLMETYSPDEFLARCAAVPILGPGLEIAKASQAEGKGGLLVTGHFGNYLAARGAFLANGIPIGVLYKRMNNPFFNAHYVEAMAKFGEPMFERGRRGMSSMIKHLRSGGFVGIVQDQRINNAPVMPFMGKPARTALSSAELALKYDIPLIPVYGVREPDGSYKVVTEPAIVRSTPEEMTQAVNASLEAQIRAHPGQWMWTHNRWRDAGNATSEDRARGKA